jgi:6-phosphogluconolactonase
LRNAVFAFVGSRTTRERNARGVGISVFRVEQTTGALTLAHAHGDLVNPTYLALNRNGSRLYAVHGDGETVSAFAVDADSGALARLNERQTQGKNPVHLALDVQEQALVVSNHLTGNVVTLAVDDNGALGEVHHSVTLDGNPGPHRIEQPFSKPHCNPFDPSGRFVVVADKGLDALFVFRYARATLTRAFRCAAREGAGPRHAVFHPRGDMLFCVNELDNTVTRYAFDAQAGRLQPMQMVSTLAESFTGNSRAAGIQLSRDGRFLYASNRGEDSVVVFRVGETGALTRVQSVSTNGQTPRFFTLSPDERWLYALNESSDTIVTFSRDVSQGLLHATSHRVTCASATCMVFSPAR